MTTSRPPIKPIALSFAPAADGPSTASDTLARAAFSLPADRQALMTRLSTAATVLALRDNEHLIDIVAIAETIVKEGSTR